MSEKPTDTDFSSSEQWWEQPGPEEMAALYPALEQYLTVFDPAGTRTFRPPETGGGEDARRVEMRKPFPWGIFFAIVCAVAVIAYVVVTGIINMPALG